MYKRSTARSWSQPKYQDQIPQNPSTMGPISSQPRPLFLELSPQAPQARAIGLWAIGLWARSPPRCSDQDDRFMHENPNQNCCEFADFGGAVHGNYMKETVTLLFIPWSKLKVRLILSQKKNVRMMVIGSIPCIRNFQLWCN